MGRRNLLSNEQRVFARAKGFDLGFDDDDEDKDQFSHVCYPYNGPHFTEPHGALCRTPRLWFQGICAWRDHPDDAVDCENCAATLLRMTRS